MPELITAHGSVRLPAFFPDATYGAVRCTPFEDVRSRGLVMNSYHLYNRPGPRLIQSLGGLHAFTGFDGVLLTDSGGFQLFSLIRENSAYGEIRESEILFRPDMGKEKLIFTPEKCIQAQFRYMSDIMMCLDVCTSPDDSFEVQRRSVDLTVKWAKRCKEEYETQLRARRIRGQRPLLFGIVQGGQYRDLRLECGKRLEEIGFDGYGFGGWPLDSEGHLREDILQDAADAMPDGKVKYAMGLGRPEEIVKLVKMGYNLFDCVIPTREARHQRLYVFREGMETREGVLRPEGDFFRYHRALDEENARDARPVDENCDCALCRSHSRAYLYHLFKTEDPQALRYSTAHNLRFYERLMELLRGDEA